MADIPNPPLPEDGANIHFAPAPAPLTVNYAQRRVVMYYVSESELNDLAKSGTSINWLLFGLCAGGFLSFLSVLLSTDITSPKKFATFVALTFVLGIFTVLFYVNGRRENKQVRGTLARIKNELRT